MRFIIMHKTNAHWESGAIPSPELIARVGTLLGELAKAGVLLGAEGLRATSEGVRLRWPSPVDAREWRCGRRWHSDARDQACERDEAPAIQWQVDDLPVIDDVSKP